MTRITGKVDVILGLIFLGIAVVMLAHVPGAVERYDREPEDLIIGLGILFPLSAFLGVTALLAGVILLRERDNFLISARTATWLLITSVVILVALSGISFMPTRSGVNSTELRLLLIPALVLAWSSYVMRRASNDRSHDLRGE